jgi:hypothetical protein
MKLIVGATIGLALLTGSGWTSSEESSLEALERNIASMEQLIVSMESSESEWKVRSEMQSHALLMSESVEITRDLFVPSSDGLNQQPGESFIKGSDENYDEIAAMELQIRILNTLLRHAIIRQNIIMERIGLFK